MMNYNVANKWWVYQRERFPVFAHSPLLLAFSFSALSYSSLLRGAVQWPESKAIVVAFCTSLLFFLQLRIADEFKDCEEDARYRPYRPVPRGLVNLRELGLLGILSAFSQLAFALYLQPALVFLLILTWLYLALMSVEFFARDWLKARPITYLWTHMLIVPLVDYYATACDWLANEQAQPSGLLWFLLVSFCNGIVIEVGRKLRAPSDEEDGVQTYTVLWGRTTAVLVWLCAMLATATFAVLAAMKIAFVLPVATILTLFLFAAVVIAIRFWQRPEARRARLFESMSGVWTLVLYLSLGAIPLLVKMGG
ncbi:MAG TPA: UbiA family prenyltransferase [Blastocatellia bacterium]|nr:UbiA family prenyltransferase [Blastocatellia bacterium]